MQRLQSRLPILLSVTFVGTIVALASRLHAWSAIALVALYLAWLAVEAKVALKETDREETRLDRGTLELYAAGRAATVITALALSTKGEVGMTALGWAGALLFVSGVGFRLIAIRTLGRFYSHRVRLAGDQKVVTSGPYAFVRHPAYAGMLIAHLGVVLFFFSWPALAVFGVVFVPAVVARIVVEERALEQALEGYREFQRGRARLLPRVW